MKDSRRGVHADFLSLPFRIEQRLVGLRDLLLLHYFDIETQDKRSHRVGGPVTLSIDEILIHHFRFGGAILRYQLRLHKRNKQLSPSAYNIPLMLSRPRLKKDPAGQRRNTRAIERHIDERKFFLKLIDDYFACLETRSRIPDDFAFFFRRLNELRIGTALGPQMLWSQKESDRQQTEERDLFRFPHRNSPVISMEVVRRLLFLDFIWKAKYSIPCPGGARKNGVVVRLALRSLHLVRDDNSVISLSFRAAARNLSRR